MLCDIEEVLGVRKKIILHNLHNKVCFGEAYFAQQQLAQPLCKIGVTFLFGTASTHIAPVQDRHNIPILHSIDSHQHSSYRVWQMLNVAINKAVRLVILHYLLQCILTTGCPTVSDPTWTADISVIDDPLRESFKPPMEPVA